MTYRFTFLRHGESTGNRDGIAQGQFDFALSSKGIDQVKALSQMWVDQSLTFDRIITSPLGRAKETAEIIQSFLKIPMSADPIWMERHRGNHQGLSKEQISYHHPRPQFIQLYDPIGETGESEWQLYIRAGTALQSLFKNPPGNYLVATHGALLNKVLHTIFGIKLQANFQGLHFAFQNTGYTTINYDTDKNQWQMLEFIQPDIEINQNDILEKTYQFTLIRHGESQGNVDNVFEGQLDTPLTEMGLTQARTIGHTFAKRQKSFDAVISSPQVRAFQTAQMICESLNLEIETSDFLKEINNGELAGMNVDEIDAHFPLLEDRINPFLPAGVHGESWFELYLRGLIFIDHLISRPPGDYLIVSHGGILNAMLWGILGIPPQPSRRSSFFHITNTGYCNIQYLPEENLWQFLSLKPSVSNIS